MPPSPDIQEISPVLDALARRGHPVAAVTGIAGDVSGRRYFRVRLADPQRPAVLAVYPDDMLDACDRYLETGRLLAAQRVRVAEVLDRDCGSGWMLLEDLGDRTLYELEGRSWSELTGFFEDAVDAIARIRRLPVAAVAGLNPPLDRALLRRELAHTREHFLVPLGLDRPEGPEGAGDDDPAGALWEALDTLCERLGAAAPAPCHRDFGARNLMPLPGDGGGTGRIAVLDHQDLRLGPPAYDLASLLNDSLFPPPEIEERLLERAGFPPGAAAREPYHRVAAQRTLKAVGSYAAFARRGSGRHLRLIPPTLARALGHLERTPETAHLAGRLAGAWRPALEGEGLDRLLAGPAAPPDAPALVD